MSERASFRVGRIRQISSIAVACLGLPLLVAAADVEIKPIGTIDSGADDAIGSKRLYVNDGRTDGVLVESSGSRVVLRRGDWTSPKFDAIIDVAFNNDGKFAYIARKGSEHRVYMDDKEGPAFERIVGSQSVGNGLYLNDVPGPTLQFSPDGKRLAYIGMKTVGDDLRYVAVVDGVEGPAVGTVKSFMFSPDSKHYTYAGELIGDRTPGTATDWSVFIDGKPGDKWWRIHELQFAPEGGDVFFIGHKPEPPPNAETASKGEIHSLVRNDAVVESHSFIRHLTITGKGDAITFAANDSELNKQYPSAPREVTFAGIVHNGKKVPLKDATAISATGAEFIVSPDGKRFAYVAKNENGVVVNVDGKSEFEYDGVTSLNFTPDSKHLYYVGSKSFKHYFVLDGEESNGSDIVGDVAVVKTPSGESRILWIGSIGRPDTGQAKRFVMIDGKEVATANFIQPSSFSFSPDGSRYAFITTDTPSDSRVKFQVVVDGKSVASLNYTDHRAEYGPFFSADGKQVAYIEGYRKKGDTTDFERMVLNGKASTLVRDVAKPCFSPDGGHLLWWNSQEGRRVRYGLVVDGKLIAPEYSAAGYLQGLPPGETKPRPTVGEFVAPNRFQYLAVKDDKDVAVITVTLPSATTAQIEGGVPVDAAVAEAPKPGAPKQPGTADQPGQPSGEQPGGKSGESAAERAAREAKERVKKKIPKLPF